MESIMSWVEWLAANPWVVAAGAVVAVAVWWMLRRPDPVLKDGAKEFQRLSEKNRGKYDDLRPLK